MNAVNDSQHAVTRDRELFYARKPTNKEYLRHAVTNSSRRPMALIREFLQLRRGRGNLTFHEYVQYGVYDSERIDSEEKTRFIANNQHWPITHACCDMTFQSVTEDKWLCSHTLSGSDIVVPRTLAIIDRGPRNYPGTRKISTVAELRDFLTCPDAFPLFAKENRGICGWGAMVALEADAKGIDIKNHGAIDYETFLNERIGDTPYLLQRLQHNHSWFDQYTDALATVRTCILLTDDGVRIPFAVLKLPSRGQVVDNFWRTGNLACDVCPETGSIKSARTKNALGTTDYHEHPETELPLVGERIPMWDRVLALVEKAAPVFEPARYQSMDIAIGNDGPIVVEVNTGGGFDLPQLASGRGFLTDEVIAFFRGRGYSKL